MKKNGSLKTFPNTTAAAAAKSLQSCPTLCDPIDGSPPGSSVPGILQARIPEWVAISAETLIKSVPGDGVEADQVSELGAAPNPSLRHRLPS